MGVLDAELGALIWLLAEHNLPLVVAGHDASAAQQLRQALTAQVRLAQPARDAIAGGTVSGGSLEEVLRVLGGSAELPDEVRDVGLVLVMRDGRLAIAHYVRPVERDAAGHLQRRPPALLAARDESTGQLDSFWWAVTDELATRAAMTRADFEDEHAARVSRLGGGSTADSSTARHH